MRTLWLTALAAFALLAGQAHAQTYQYVATTTAPAARTGAVAAGPLTWQCTGSECRISGPWPAPGVSACTALAQQVGRIASYGRSGAMLSAEQLAQCNANLPAATAVQINPQVATQIRPQQPQIGGGALNRPNFSASTALATNVRTTEVAVEPVGGAGDLIVHVLPTPGIQFYGVTPALPAPTPPAPVVRIVSGRIDTAGIRLQASAPGAVPTPRSATTSEAPQYSRGLRRDVVLRVPVSLRDMPADTAGIQLVCKLFVSRFVPFVERERVPGDPEGEGLLAEPAPGTAGFFYRGSRAADREVAFGAGWAYIRNIGNFSTTLDIPLQTRPFFRLQDARSYQCDVFLQRTRASRPGIDSALLSATAGPSGPAGFRPAAGTTPILTVEGNLQ